LREVLLALVVGFPGCSVASSGRGPLPVVQESTSKAVPAGDLVFGTAPRWTRRVLPFSNTLGSALVTIGDGSIALVVGGAIARSTDLGRSWDIAPAPSSETLYSNDGGEHFVDLATARRRWFLKPIGDDSFETVATALVGTRIYVLSRGSATRRLSSISVAPVAVRTFHRVFSHDGPDGVCLASTGARVLVGGVVGRRPVVLESDDEGNGWHPAWWGTSIPVAITFLTATQGVLLLRDGTLLRTSDGCETWLVAGAVPLDCASPSTAMGWADDRVGYVVGRNGLIIVTRDGGRNWKRARATSVADLNAVKTVSLDEAWVVGSAGTIMRTRNGGATWSRVDLGIGEDLRSISHVERSILIVGDGSLWIFPLEDYAAGSTDDLY
jgi:hypothetical protein